MSTPMQVAGTSLLMRRECTRDIMQPVTSDSLSLRMRRSPPSCPSACPVCVRGCALGTYVQLSRSCAAWSAGVTTRCAQNTLRRVSWVSRISTKLGESGESGESNFHYALSRVSRVSWVSRVSRRGASQSPDCDSPDSAVTRLTTQIGSRSYTWYMIVRYHMVHVNWYSYCTMRVQ